MENNRPKNGNGLRYLKYPLRRNDADLTEILFESLLSV